MSSDRTAHPRLQFAVLLVGAWAAMAGLVLLLAKGGEGGLALVGAAIAALLAILLRRHGAGPRESAAGAAELAEHRTQVELAEQLLGVGWICVGVPGYVLRWSTGFCRLAGLEAGAVPSRDVLAALLPQGIGQLCTTLEAHGEDREPFAVEFELVHPEKGECVLHARAQNHFDAFGRRDKVFLVVRDVTEEYRRIAQIEADKAKAIAQARAALRLAEIDPLTGIANRRAAMSALDRSLVTHREEGRSTALLLFDIDNFKGVNDRHGHPAGDKVLRRIAELAQRQARLGDCVARIGGEEFLWIRPDCDEDCAQDAAERLRWAVEAGTALAPMPGVTISVGWAMQQAQDTSLTLLARADAALYAAKREGRNRVRAAA